MPIVPKKHPSADAQTTVRANIVVRTRPRRPSDPGASPAPQPVTPPPSPPKEGAAAADYDIGYKKPPKSGQFKPGQSGNPKGRPKGAKGLNTIVREIMTEKVLVRTPRGTKKITKLEALVRKTAEGAFGDSQRDRQRMFEYAARALSDDPAAASRTGANDDGTPLTSQERNDLDRAMMDELRQILLASENDEEAES